MITHSFGSYEFIVDYVHLTFLVGIVASVLYFRSRQISLGGSLAVGYLAASLYKPLDVLATLAVALLSFVLIRYCILKIWLPRPRQIFAIGLIVGIVGGGLWMLGSNLILGTERASDSLALVGIVIPGMICNSLVKQGVTRTLVPLAIFVPLAGLAGLTLTLLTTTLLPTSLSGMLFHVSDDHATVLFAGAAVSVITALLLQQGTAGSWQLRTGGYVTMGMIIASVTHVQFLVVLAVTTLLLVLIFTPYSRRVPLFGKDRFLVLAMLSFFLVTALEIVAVSLTGVRFGGAENIVFCILPAIIANDVIQYGLKRTAGGMTIAAAVSLAVVGPLSLILN